MVFTSHSSPFQRLRGFIDVILMEERRFQLWDHLLDVDYKQLLATHNRIADRCDCARSHRDIRIKHEAIFTRHREISTKHVEYTNYCLKLNEQLKSEIVDSEQVISEIEILSDIYEKMREQHHQMEIERKEVLKEHNKFADELNENDFILLSV